MPGQQTLSILEPFIVEAYVHASLIPVLINVILVDHEELGIVEDAAIFVHGRSVFDLIHNLDLTVDLGVGEDCLGCHDAQGIERNDRLHLFD